MKLLKKLFAYRKVKNELKHQKAQLRQTSDNYSRYMSQQQKAKLFCKKNEITYCIKVLKGLL